jgi:catechol 2,3-dioxygenase-like lactoylglutathione lyase family enzyme
VALPESIADCEFIGHDVHMTITLNHTNIASRDRQQSATFYARLFGLPQPVPWGPFVTVSLDQGMLLQFAEPNVADIQMQHYAFLVDDQTFDLIYGRIQDDGIAHWADPRMTQPDQVNANHGGRGVYFFDPSGHGLELITRPYGSDLPGTR